MNFRSKEIIMKDWAGNLLFIGDYDDEQVSEVLQANRCEECDSGTICDPVLSVGGTCPHCEGSSYKGDFIVFWYDTSDKDDCNVYEYIGY